MQILSAREKLNYVKFAKGSFSSSEIKEINEASDFSVNHVITNIKK